MTWRAVGPSATVLARPGTRRRLHAPARRTRRHLRRHPKAAGANQPDTYGRRRRLLIENWLTAGEQRRHLVVQAPPSSTRHARSEGRQLDMDMCSRRGAGAGGRGVGLARRAARAGAAMGAAARTVWPRWPRCGRSGVVQWAMPAWAASDARGRACRGGSALAGAAGADARRLAAGRRNGRRPARWP